MKKIKACTTPSPQGDYRKKFKNTQLISISRIRSKVPEVLLKFVFAKLRLADQRYQKLFWSAQRIAFSENAEFFAGQFPG